MKYTNNSYITEDTLKAFNEWLRDVYNIKASFIHPDGIQAATLREAVAGWRDTNAASRSVVNTIPVWLYRLFIEFMKNNYKRSQQFGSPYVDDRELIRSYIVNLLDHKPIANKDDANYKPIYATRIERRFTVPEGYDGNAAFVRLLVPPEVITWLHRRPYDTTDIQRLDLSGNPTNALCAHPLLRADYSHVDNYDTADIVADGGYGCSCGNLNTADYYGVPANADVNHLTSQLYGNFRTSAFFFYQQYVKNGNILMDVNKNKTYVEFICECDEFRVPFMNYTIEDSLHYTEADQLVAPKVLVEITYYKRGIY